MPLKVTQKDARVWSPGKALVMAFPSTLQMFLKTKPSSALINQVLVSSVLTGFRLETLETPQQVNQEGLAHEAAREKACGRTRGRVRGRGSERLRYGVRL